MTGAFCPSCGEKVREGDKFCSSCGEALSGSGARTESRDAEAGRAARWLRRLVGTTPRERVVTAMIVIALVVAVVAFLALD